MSSGTLNPTKPSQSRLLCFRKTVKSNNEHKLFICCVAVNMELPCATIKMNKITECHADSEYLPLPVLTADDAEQHINTHLAADEISTAATACHTVVLEGIEVSEFVICVI